VKPNIMFIMDDTESMQFTYMPDELREDADKSCYANSAYNSLYYDPEEIYVAPKKADGTDYPDADFTAAWTDGYDASRGTVDLSKKFQVDISLGDRARRLGTRGPAYYMEYNSSVRQIS